MSFAAGPQGVHDPGTGIVSPETKESAQGTGQGMMQAAEETKTSAQQGIHEPGTGLTTPELKEAAQGTGQGLEAKAEEVVNETAGAAKAQPGFETTLALLGIIAASFGLLRRRQ
ncbi:MAG TPA: PGF-CTERM sorting domain-containing protein [Methanothrix sp.]|nr:PGF-CTERM sorting domain-containing protein [Methanothrix sp.]